MRPKLTYSNVVSTICLFLLLGGGAAYAASHLGKNSVGSKQLKKNAVTTAKIKKEAVTAAKVKKGTLTGTQINVSTLGTVPGATHADTASTAASATTATSANPEAFAHIGGNGTVDAANSKGITQANVTAFQGTYCFSGLPFQPRGGQAIIDYSDGSEQAAQFDLGDGGGCPVGTQAFVYTYTAGKGFSPTTFYVSLYR